MDETQKDDMITGYLALYAKAGIFLTEEEKTQVWHWDFYTGSEAVGLSCVTYFKTARCCARELALLPRRFTPEHKHPPVHGKPGREKTLRCRWGMVYLYVEGEKTEDMHSSIPEDMKANFTALKEIALEQGQQYTLPPDTLSWLQAGEQGCVLSEFSTEAMDSYDVYTDPAIMREHRKRLA